MALYLFHCKEHGVQEVFQAMTEDHTWNCPNCGKKCSRIFTSPTLSNMPTRGTVVGEIKVRETIPK